MYELVNEFRFINVSISFIDNLVKVLDSYGIFHGLNLFVDDSTRSRPCKTTKNIFMWQTFRTAFRIIKGNYGNMIYFKRVMQNKKA
jgi:hypothetical protein